MKLTPSYSLIALLSITAISAQEPMQSSEPAPAEAQALDRSTLFRVPIHTAEPDGEEKYGLWASGTDYKVAFDQGVTFYPVLGKEYTEHLPLRWSTQSIRTGQTSICVPEQDRVIDYTDWRYVIDHGSVREVYEVRNEGVEQLFIIDRQQSLGQIVVEGRVETPLLVDTVTERHASLIFRTEDGTEILEYGAAVAIDATGTRWPMTTSYDEGVIRLTLDADSANRAIYPLTLDPLLSTRIIASSGAWRAPDIARDDRRNELLVSYTRAMTLNDYDAYAAICKDDFSNPTVVYADTGSWSTYHAKVAFVGGPRKWVVALHRKFTNTTGVRVHLHDSGDLTLSSIYQTILVSPGRRGMLPEVGGTETYSTGDNAIITFMTLDSSLQSWANVEAHGVIIDTKNEQVGTPFLLDRSTGGVLANGNDRDRRWPKVTQISEGGASGSWVASWHEYNNSIPNDDWDLMVARINPDGSDGGRRSIGNGSATVHSFNAHVAGRGGRYLCTYSETPNSGYLTYPEGAWAMRAIRFDWADSPTKNIPAVQSPKTVKIAKPTQNLAFAFSPSTLAFDHTSRSHWALTYSDLRTKSANVMRIGYDAEVVEDLHLAGTSLQDQAGSPAVTFDDDAQRFPVVYAHFSAQSIKGNHMVYGPAAVANYGTGCGGAAISANSKPHSGSEFFAVRLINAKPATPATLIVGVFGSPPFSLGSIGMGGCYLNLNAATIITGLPTVTDNIGFSELQLSIPSKFSGNLNVQWAYLDQGLNALGVAATKGMRIEVR